MTKKVEKADDEWREQLTPEEFAVCRKKGTERAFTGKYNDYKAPGVYYCTCCGDELFSSEAKFDSGTGWPSFTTPVDTGAIQTEDDNTYGMTRTEVMCGSCGAHLGHVFPDGPGPTGQRYCMNSVALKHSDDKESKE